MAEKSFGVKEVNLIGASGTPSITSPNNINLNAVNVAISTNVSIGGTLTVSGSLSIGGTITYEDVTNVDSVGIVTARNGLNVSGGNVTIAKDIDVDGHTNLDNVSIAGVATATFFSGSASAVRVIAANSVAATVYPTFAGSGATQAGDLNIKTDNSLTYNSQSGELTAVKFTGDGSSLTSLPAANLTGTLPAISGANLTGIAVTEAPVTDYTITADSGSNYFFHGGGVDETDGNPDLYLIRGQKYRFNNTTGSGHPFRFTHTGNANAAYSNGVTGTESGVQFWTIPYDAPAKLFYVCTIHSGMVGNIYIRGAAGNNTNVGVVTATAFIPSSGQLSHRNIIINGAMMVAQRATSATGVTANGYATVDRFTATQTGTDDYIEQHQVDVSSGTTPYTSGFRKAFQVKNGNQTSGAGAGDYIKVVNKLEAQDIANSGWNYKSASSFITLSYWVRSSVAQTFFVRVTSLDSPVYNFPFSYAVSANTWTKVTKAIPGNSNLVFNNDNGVGLDIEWTLFRGTNSTGSGATLDTWAAYDSSQRQPDNTSTWYTTNDATWEITGIQFEVGPVATPFEHRSYGEELLRCKRYYQRSTDSSRGTDYTLSTGTWHSADGSQSFSKHNSYYDWKQNFEVEMRVAPTLTIYGSSNQGDIHLESIAVGSKQVDWNNNTTEVKTKGFLLRHIEDQSSGNYTSGSGNAFGILAYTVDAEL